MSREKETFRDNLALLLEKYPDRSALTVDEAAKELGMSRKSVTAAIERRVNPLPARDVSRGKMNRVYRIPITAIANWLS